MNTEVWQKFLEANRHIKGPDGRRINWNKVVVDVGDGEEYPVREKVPFPQSGHGSRGAVYRDTATDTVMCHECSVWVKSVARHMKVHPEMTLRAYRWKHGITLQMPICSRRLRVVGLKSALLARKRWNEDSALRETVREHLATGCAAARASRLANGTPPHLYAAKANRQMNCPPQSLEYLWDQYQILGRRPKQAELVASERGAKVWQTLRTSHGTVARACDAAGIPPDDRPFSARYSLSEMTNRLRDACIKIKRSPTNREMAVLVGISRSVFVKRFGSWPNALKATGLEVPINGFRARKAKATPSVKIGPALAMNAAVPAEVPSPNNGSADCVGRGHQGSGESVSSLGSERGELLGPGGK